MNIRPDIARPIDQQATSGARVIDGTVSASLAYSLAGQIIYLVTQLGVLSGLAHFHGPKAVGAFGLALALATPLFLLANMGFRTAQASDVVSEYSFADYGGVRVLFTALAVISSIVLGYFFSEGPATFLVVAVVTCSKVFESVSNLSYGAFQQAGRMDLVAASYALRGGFTLIAFISLLLLGAGTPTALLAQVAVWAIVGLLVDYPRASRLAIGRVVVPRWSWKQSWSLIRGSAPLAGGVFANSLQVSVPRLLIERCMGLESLGLFTAVDYFLQASVIASNSVSHALVNRFARLHHNNERSKLRRLVVRLLLVFLCVGLTGIAACYYFGEFILVTLFGHSYASASALLFIISIAIGVRMLSVLPQTVLVAERRFTLFFSFQLAALALTLILGYYAISTYGLLGAGYVLLFVAIFRLLFLEVVAIRARKDQPRRNTTPVSGKTAPVEDDEV